MSTRNLGTAIVGASTLLGKEVAQQLAEAGSNASISLLDEEMSAGQMTAAGDEAFVISPLTPGALSDFDLVFFCSDRSTAKTHWAEVKQSGAAVIDLTGALADETGIVTVSPWIQGSRTTAPDLTTVGIAVAHPAALFMAVVASRLQRGFGKLKIVATVLQPASQYGQPALDELHAQTTALLTFQAPPREIFDAQSAYNLLPRFGPEAKPNLATDAQKIRKDFAALTTDAVLELQLIQAPVFHSFAASLYVEFSAGAIAHEDIAKALGGEYVQVRTATDDPPTNQSAVEQDSLLLSIQKGSDNPGAAGAWIWLCADNLRLAARHAVACASELVSLQPTKAVQ